MNVAKSGISGTKLGEACEVRRRWSQIESPELDKSEKSHEQSEGKARFNADFSPLRIEIVITKNRDMERFLEKFR